MSLRGTTGCASDTAPSGMRWPSAAASAAHASLRRDEALLARGAGIDDRLVLEPADAELAGRVAVADCLHPRASSWFDPAQGTLGRMATHALSLADVNLLDHDMFAEREPWDVFELLQREAPVFRHPEPDGDGFWCVTRYDDVVQVLKDTAVYSSEDGGAALIEPVPDDVLEARRNFMETDPPLHSQWRRMFARDFTPRSLADRYTRVPAASSRAACSTRRCRRASSTSSRRSPGPSRSACSGTCWACRTSISDKLVELGDRMLVPDRPRPHAAVDADAGGVEVPAVRLGGRRRAARARAAADRGAQGPSVRRRALDPRERRDRRLPRLAARPRQQPRAARRGRQRDDPPGHGARAARADGAPGPARAAALRSVDHALGRRRADPLRLAGLALPPHGGRRHRVARRQDPQGRPRRRVVRRRQPRPRGVPRSAPPRPHAQARRPRRVRPRRPALLPRRAPRPPRDGGALRAAAAAPRVDRADRPARRACARTSRTASSACPCASSRRSWKLRAAGTLGRPPRAKRVRAEAR